MIFQGLDKNKLHHAYLIEGLREEVSSEILEFLRSMGIKTSGNPDFCHISVDTFRIEDARNLKSFGYERGVSGGKKIFLISANNFLLDAQNTLLKMFEEPAENTHFFVIAPDKNIFLKTLVSRFYLISAKNRREGREEIERFLKLARRGRIDFIKELISSGEEDDEEENNPGNSVRLKALRFLNHLEEVLSEQRENEKIKTECFRQILKAREFLSQPGSSIKNLMESVALIVPIF